MEATMCPSQVTLRAGNFARQSGAFHFDRGGDRASGPDPEPAAVVERPVWRPEEIVQLHFLLLDDLERLADPRTPLEEKFELLEWVFTDPDKENQPFSFKHCVRLYKRTCDHEHVRETIAGLVPRWLRESVARLPGWLAEQILRDPQWAAMRLHRNPQWINEQLRAQEREPDLFSGLAC
jgi:hypothetical protein